MEQNVARRKALSSLGLISGAVLLSGCAKSLGSATVADPASDRPQTLSDAGHAWKYVPLDPDELADRAYRMYPDGGCMYSMVGSVILTLAERYGKPYSEFPFAMMRYGEGGVAKWGSLCGVVNGAAALIGLFYPEDAKRRESLIGAFARWYESTELPVYQPKDPPPGMEIPSSVAGSILCHVSVGKWCEASGEPAFSKAKSERCRRLTADGVKKLVTLLNEVHAQPERELIDMGQEAKACNSCHGKSELADAMVKMDCRSCHDLTASHATQVGKGTPSLPGTAHGRQ